MEQFCSETDLGLEDLDESTLAHTNVFAQVTDIRRRRSAERVEGEGYRAVMRHLVG
jgi:hypothetical protein